MIVPDNNEEGGDMMMGIFMVVMCGENHPMVETTQPKQRKGLTGETIQCNECGDSINLAESYMTCQEDCDSDLCKKCSESACKLCLYQNPFKGKKCDGNHKLVRWTEAKKRTTEDGEKL